MENEVLSVTDFVALVNQTLEFALPLLVVEGEVSGFRVNQGKWVFFDLKDDSCTVSCFLPVFQLKVPLEDGMLIRVMASPNLTKWGKFSLTVREISLSGEGAIKRAFELQKARFEAEGLFAPERKRLLPVFPRRVALITSAQAAAFNDFITIIRDRWPYLIIDHAQVAVQGVAAPAQVCNALRYFNSAAAEYDALVVIRGGGSLEDLQAFNHEDVVRAVYGSKIPALVAIGHEDDVTLAELAADVRGATPTDAARRLVPDARDVRRTIRLDMQHASAAVERRLAALRQLPLRFISSFAQLSGQLQLRLQQASRGLHYAAETRLQTSRHRLHTAAQVLDSLNPRAILRRGYSIASVRGQIIKQAAQIQAGDEVMLQLFQGQVLLKRKGHDDGEPAQTKLQL